MDGLTCILVEYVLMPSDLTAAASFVNGFQGSEGGDAAAEWSSVEILEPPVVGEISLAQYLHVTCDIISR